jgi:hypothetical protein
VLVAAAGLAGTALLAVDSVAGTPLVEAAITAVAARDTAKVYRTRRRMGTINDFRVRMGTVPPLEGPQLVLLMGRSTKGFCG